MKKKILIVDDDEYVIDLLSFALKRHEYNVLISRDGYQALDVIDKEQPDMLVIDFMMPKINGLQLCEELSKNEQTKSIPKIILTASGRVEQLKIPEGYGVRHIMKKPFNTNELIDNIKRILTT